MHTPFSPVLGSCWLVRTGSLLAERMRSLEAANRSMSRTDREYEPAGEATVRGGGKKKKKDKTVTQQLLKVLQWKRDSPEQNTQIRTHVPHRQTAAW